MTGNTAMWQVTSPDGVRLAVYEAGDRAAPTIVAVHGYPDNHRTWGAIADRLSTDHRVVTYDVRGAGESDKPRGRAPYRISRLIDDLGTVLDAVDSKSPVHLLGHDWGSIQLWPALTDERLSGRIASFTSISGPSLDHAGAWIRDLREHPRDSLRQLAHSYYMIAFQLPRIPEALVRAGVVERGVRKATGTAHGEHGTRDDQLHGIWLYRANALRRAGLPRPTRIEIPVQVIVADRDPFATPALAVGAPRRWVSDLTVHHVDAGHWVIHEDPDTVADLVRTFVRDHPQRPTARSRSDNSSSR